jgi:hypothetical protein
MDDRHPIWDDIKPATRADVDRMRGEVERVMADVDVGPLIARIDALEALLADAFRAGSARTVADHMGFRQTHPGLREWVSGELEALDG